MKIRSTLLGVAAVATIATAAYAYDFDAATGAGFVGKGEVQLVFGWNNKALQDKHAGVEFRSSSEVVTEVSWTCTNTNNQNVQERERTTTTSIAGVLSHTARDRNQITGFILTGYEGDPAETSTSEGNQVNSCPTNWVLTPAGEPEVVSSSSSLQVRALGFDWTDL